MPKVSRDGATDKLMMDGYEGRGHRDGQRRDDRPSESYRNILRAGFTELGVTPNWLGSA